MNFIKLLLTVLVFANALSTAIKINANKTIIIGQLDIERPVTVSALRKLVPITESKTNPNSIRIAKR